MAKNTSTAHVVITMEGKQAVNLIQSLKEKAEATRKELTKMQQAANFNADSEKYQKTLELLKSQEAAIKQNKTAYVDLKKVVADLSGTTLRELERSLKECRKQMKGMTENNPRFKELSAQYRAIDGQIQKMNGSFSRQRNVVENIIKRLSAYVFVYVGFNQAISLLDNMIKKNLAFSDSLADIRKTSGLSAESVGQLSKAIMKIDTRTSVDSMHKLLYEAGRLGIGGMGAKAMEGFAKAADQVNVALGEDLGGEKAITTLMKMNQVMGLIPTLGIEKSLLATGSAINELAQTSTASGEYIANYASRLSGVARQAHLTTAELLGFGAASDATGQEIEVSATAMNKFVVQLQTHYKTVAKAAGVSQDALHSLLEQGRTADAVVMVLRSLSEKGGLSILAPLMKDLGSDGARLTASLATLASNIDLVEQSLAVSRQGFEQATSVTNEYNIKNENAAAIMERMKNSWDKMILSESSVGVIKDMAQDFYDLSRSLQTNKLLLFEVRTVLFLLITAVKALFAMLPYLAIFLSVKGWVMLASVIRGQLVPSFFSMISAIGGIYKTMVASAVGVNGLRRAWVLLNAVMKSNMFVAIATILFTVVTSVIALTRKSKELKSSMDFLNSSIQDYGKESRTATTEADNLFNKLKFAKKGTDERNALLGQINQKYKTYLPFMLTEKSTLEDIAKAQEVVNTKLRQSIAYKTQNQTLDEIGQRNTPQMAAALDVIKQTAIKVKAPISMVLGDLDQLQELAAKYRTEGMPIKEASETIYANTFAKSEYWGSDLKKIRSAISDYVKYYNFQMSQMYATKQKYKPLIGDYTPVEEIPDKNTIIENPDESKEKKKRREQLRIAKGEYEAVMSAIEVYYKMQEQVIKKAYINRNISAEQMEQELDDIETRHLQTRIEARKRLHGDDNTWENELKKLKDSSLASTKDTQDALGNLMGKNLVLIGQKLRKFGEAEDDGIWKKLEEDKLKLQDVAIEHRKAVEKVLLEYDFSGKVTTEYQAALEKLGVFFTAYKEGVKGGFANVDEAAREGLKSLRDMVPQMMDLDINTEEGIAQFKTMLSEVEAFGAKMLNMANDDYKSLYYKAIEYADAMTEAEKKSRERQLKIAKERYTRSPQYKENEAKQSREKSSADIYGQAQGLGLVSEAVVKDAEVELYKARLEAAVDYYNYLATHGYDVEAQQIKIQEAVNDLSEKMVEKTRTQLDVLKSFTDNVSQFGADMGDSWRGSLEDRRKALESFVRGVGASTQKLIMEWVKEKIEHEMIRHSMVKTEQESKEQMTDVTRGSHKVVEKVENQGARAAMKRAGKWMKDQLTIKKKTKKEEESVEKQSQDTQSSIAEVGGKAVGQTIIQMGNQVVSAKKSQAAENVGTSVKETSVDVQAGIAGGAAKTIGQLGWWGIPLVAVLEGVLNALLGSLMSKVASMFGGSNSPAATSTKLVTGMLTYDKGNVQDSGMDNKITVKGNDGKTYEATPVASLSTGLVSSPIATSVNGKPAIVGEYGPEIVIGRETTAALMMTRPDLVSEIMKIDRQHSGRTFATYDKGNLQSIGGGGGTPADIGQLVSDAVGKELAPILNDVKTALSVNADATSRLNTRLEGNIYAKIVKYGANGLIEETIDGMDYLKKTRSNDKLNRLLSKDNK